MSNHKTSVLLPVSRLVAGSLTEPATTDYDGNPLVIKSGANKGQPRVDWWFCLAAPKNGAVSWWDTEWGKKILAVGQAAFPQQSALPDFSWKIEDGDSTRVNKKGKRNCDKEGYPGNFIIRLGSGFAPKVLDASTPGMLKEIDPALVKAGYWVEASCTVDGNTGSTPGVYLNHQYVAFRAPGPEIFIGPDPSEIGFGAMPLPPGVNAAPAPMTVQPSTPPAAGTPTPPAAATPPAPPVAAAPAAPTPPVPTVPHTAILAGPPAPPAHVMLPAAQGASYEACIAAGWTDELLVANGMMQA